MATDNDVTRLTVENANLEFAARCFREAASMMRAQRDDARREACALRHRTRIAALVIAVIALLVIGVVACVEAAETAGPQLVRIDRATAETAARQAVVHSTVQSTELTDYSGYIVYEVVVAGKDGQTHQVTVDAGNARILLLETSEKEPEENDGQDLNLGSPRLAMTYQVERFPLGGGKGTHGTRTGATHNTRRPLPLHPPPSTPMYMNPLLKKP
jgi:uncharacterized membrane protein YkoI